MFVYGSLKADGQAHHLLAGAEPVGKGVLDHVVTTQHAGYPMLRSGIGSVQGEIYRVPEDLWPTLDAWEDVPEVYQRRQRKLRDGRSVWVYEAA